ncbi:hypothetical protein SRB5_28170 [Streptomyces sp. RB5]|uniref:DUF3566 domain-containing protein n=1 Tax=Streptomyces smaragdinus TaxID=2585196 RepID=A0A7K0CGS7_9ACTN|nr:DUF3566 domain-containing protein [Streptomyces smaragdinus]MQY12681.1 hypothetical protein [Streptomyces smaragdinus]
MSGATGAGASREGYVPADSPPGEDDGARGPATSGSQGGTVTDTRHTGEAGRTHAAAQAPADPAAAGPLPPPPALPPVAPGPHHPPQAYQPPAAAPAPAPAAHGAAHGRGSGRGARNSAAVRRSRTGARTVPRTRKARLRVAKADPWSVMKVSFLLSIALGLCTVVAVAMLWMVLDAMGVFSTVGSTLAEATEAEGNKTFDLESFLSLPRVLSFTAVIAVIDVVLATALATLGAFIYNLSAGFVGGVELTLAEDE